MPVILSVINRSRVAMFVALLVFLFSVSMLTYSGRIESTDAVQVFDAISSRVRFGDLYLDESLWMLTPSRFSETQTYPLLNYGEEEPLQVILASLLFWLADHLPGIGLVHTVWLFNILVATATGGLLFLYALALGYDERVGILAALLFAFGSAIWPYSKTFFREPLAQLMLLLTAFLLERWRAGRYRSPVVLLGVLVAAVGAFTTKQTTIFAFPALFLVSLPTIRLLEESDYFHRVLTVLLGLAIVLTVFFAFSDVAQNLASLGIPLFISLQGTLTSTRVALHSYLFSVGGSVWGTSPVLLLALPGLWRLYRQRQQRYVWTILLVVLGYAFGHAFLRGIYWFGGLSWPPRFLIPVLPFLMLGALPVLQRIMSHPRRRWLIGIVALIAAYSVWVQFSGLSLDWGLYPAALPPESPQLGEWGPGMNEIQYLRWVVIPSLWSQHELEFAWVRIQSLLGPMMFTLLATVSAGVLWQLQSTGEKVPRGMILVASGLLPLLLLISVGVSLRLLYDNDVIYHANNRALHNLLPLIERETQPGDVVLLDDNIYERFFENYAKLDAPRFIILPAQPGERPSEIQPPQIVSENPDGLLTPTTIPVINHLASDHDRLWVVMHFGPFIPWAIRPIERFMAAHYYPIRELQTDPPDPEVRLLEYSTARAPDPFAFRGAAYPSDLRYGASIRLLGYDLPSGLEYAPGDALPLSLYWLATESLEIDYKVARFLVSVDSGIIVDDGEDWEPGAGFSPTTEWQPGAPVRDNRAFRLPSDLPPGSYRLWVVLYAQDSDGTPQRLPVTEGAVTDDNVGILPMIIEVQP